ncbi:hypothetical protein NitYY0826_C0512 [Nitratiruptor sp. YY08-26]|uniref:hypothetical protein n=1 Tax=unclassified Nitratiruptor TaxID=2624044 RepID=UPI001916118C|nr:MULTISPECIES: hypothetical protein [unclassified Nitratiruptor]BCD61651.1 hypothetical protein NitYY0813_C0510 [Nitratiruptor sp. YY08-13]BCD65586.1 hypothetical protein NitYY0826_C0512 [Nitratiruptor sp. YY08-26]
MNYPSEFIITEFTDGYVEEDFLFHELGFEYALDILEIPDEFLEDVEYIADEGLKIYLDERKIEEYIGMDWYYNLLPYEAKLTI